MDHPTHNRMKTLRQTILAGIEREEFRRARMRLATSAVLMPVSAFGIVYSIRYAAEALAQSGFYSYASLALSDSDVVLAYWREFALSLLGSLPFAAFIALIATGGLLLWAARIFAANVRTGFAPSFANV
ncbi:MAG: hypothetical protein HGA67_01805 [Candidatus Yonathbacteria bacterium]|nr:hypothetical protein [Candidatus Yonathbacteria bacterium]